MATRRINPREVQNTNRAGSTQGGGRGTPNCGPGKKWDPVKKTCVPISTSSGQRQTQQPAPIQTSNESTSGWTAGQKVNGPNRWLTNGGAVVDGVYLPPGTLAPKPATSPTAPPTTTTPSGGATGTIDRPADTPLGRPDLWGPGDMIQADMPAEEVPMEEMPVDQATAALLEWQKAQAEAARQQARESAKAVLFGLLADYGLSDLENTVWGWIQGGDTEAASLIQRIRKEKTYQERFKGMELRRGRGLNMPSEAEYIGLENTYRQIMRSAGLPANLFDQPDDLANLIGYDVSPAELNARIQEGYQAVRQSNPEVVNQMRRLYGVTEGELAAYFLDPERTLPMLTRQARSAQIAGQAQVQAGQAITAGTAEELAVAGVTQEQAREGFQTIAGAQELFGTLAGTTEEAISAEEQIAGVFATSQAAQQRIRQRARERQSIFEQGGRFTGQGTTVTGLQ